MDNKKNFDLYVFFSSFARNLIEVFIGTILFKAGFSIKEVVLFYLLFNLFSFIIAFPCIWLSKKYSNRVLAVISAISFGLLQLVLGFITPELSYLILVGFLYALYRRTYWVSRRYYTLKVIQKKDIAKDYSIVSIVNQVSILISSYVGALLLDFVSINALTIISVLLFVISVIFLNNLKFEHEKNDYKIEVIKTIKSVPKSFMFHMGVYETQAVLKFLIPLYIFIYVSNTYSAIGLLNLIVYLATLVFTYLYGKIINDKKNYLKLSLLLFVIIYILKVNTFGIVLYIVSFLEGFISKMYEQSFNKEYLVMSKKYEYYNYNMLYEIVQNAFRVILTLVLFLFVNDLKIMIYLILLLMTTALFVDIKLDSDYISKDVEWKDKKKRKIKFERVKEKTKKV